jgi:hypothetical protein
MPESMLFRPKKSLWLSGWIICMAFSLPVFFALYLISAPQGRWLPFAIAHATVLLLFAAVVWRLRGSGVRLSADGIRERAYLAGTVFTPAHAVASAIVVPLRDVNSDELSEQLFLVDADGHTVLRLRGQLWHRADLYQITNYYGVPVRRVEAAMTWRQLRSSFGTNLEPWERHPVLTGIVLASILIVVVAAGLLAAMAATA